MNQGIAKSDFSTKGFLSEANDMVGWKRYFRDTHKEWIDLHEDVNALAMQMYGDDGAVTQYHLEKALADILFVRLLSNFQTILLLSEKGLNAEAQIILRSMVEATFAIVATAKEKEFAKRYLRHTQFQQKRIIQNQLRFHPTDAELLQVLKTYEQFSEKDYLPVSKIAEIAEMNPTYKKEYSVLCMYGHPSVWGLSDSITFDSKNKPLGTQLEPSDEFAESNLRLASEMMLKSMESFSSLFRLEEEEAIRHLSERLRSISYKATFAAVSRSGSSSQ